MIKSRTIYIPGYREENKLKFPGYEIQKYCEDTKKRFARIILPGEPEDFMKEEFSGNAIQQKIRLYLSSKHNFPLILNVYSLSCREVADALLNTKQETLDMITQVNFLAPNINPIHSIQMMDWATNPTLIEPIKEEIYLYGNAQEVFSSLMKPVGNNGECRGDPFQFQKDLQRYKTEDALGETFISKIERLEEKGVSCNIITSENDQIVNLNQVTRMSDRGKISALGSHILGKNDLERLYEIINKYSIK